MSREDKEAQEDELLALASIYSEDEFKRSETAPGGEICVCLDLPPNFSVAIKGDCASNEYMGSFEDIVSFLPPIILDFELPPGYPSTDPPAFKLSCKWLSPSQLALLCQRLDDLWVEYAGEVVLFAWMQFLKEGTLEYLKINSPYEIQLCEFGPKCIKNNLGISDSCSATGPAEAVIWDTRAIQDVESVTTLIDCILEFNEAQQKKCFDSKSYMCDICFSEKVGSECTHFKKCEHIYCNACLKDYYTVQIQDGQVQALNCPEPKCSSVATPAQYPVKEKRMQQHGLSTHFHLCCKYAFCTFCKLAYHAVAYCNITSDGCNRMFCTRCNNNFCWLCLAVLSKEDPYDHFNSSSSGCFNLLYEPQKA
uniref:RBR-type E3 ubiquitin transferase n=1 Tax=Xenopus tropicalis TaxID=8364 RepID=A0A1B8XWQ7_XENTR